MLQGQSMSWTGFMNDNTHFGSLKAETCETLHNVNSLICKGSSSQLSLQLAITIEQEQMRHQLRLNSALVLLRHPTRLFVQRPLEASGSWPLEVVDIRSPDRYRTVEVSHRCVQIAHWEEWDAQGSCLILPHF